MAYPIPLDALDETPVQIAGGSAGKIETITIHNPDASSGAYIKIYESVEAPDGTSVPRWKAWVGAGGSTTFAPFIDVSSVWMAASTDASAGLSAPGTPFEGAITFEGS